MKLTESEWQIMNALWRCQPATAREVRGQLPPDVQWAYTTVKTLLSRLAAKNAVHVEMRGNTSVYRPRVSQRRARSTALRSLLEHAFDGAVGPLLHFLVCDRKLSAKERQQLLRLLQEEREEGS